MNSSIVTVIEGPTEFFVIGAFFERSPRQTVEFLAESAPPDSIAASRNNRFSCSINLVARNSDEPDQLFIVGMTDDWETPAKPKLDLLPATTTTFKMAYDTRIGKGRMLMGISGGKTGQVDDYYDIFRRLHIH